MRLKPGDRAGDFDTQDLEGRRITLKDYAGSRLLLSFHRYASCPLCNLRVHQLIRNQDRFNDQGLQVLAVFQSPPESIIKYVGRQKAPFPLVADPQHVMYRAYGVETSWGGFVKGGLRVVSLTRALGLGFRPGHMEGRIALVPADFLIGPDLTINHAYYGRDIGDHLSLPAIEAWLQGN